MSFPSVAPIGAMGAAAAMAQISPFEQAVLALNSNPYFIGTMMLMLNLGGRFIAMEMSKSQEQFFQNPWVRRLLLFTVVFVGTRNVVVAFWMSIVIILLIGYLFNENSSLCLFNLGTEGSSCATNSVQAPAGPIPMPPGMPGMPVQGLTPEESEIFKRLQDKQMRAGQPQAQAPQQQETQPNGNKKKTDASATDIYWQNMMLLKQKEGFYGNPRF
jgi:hypothetical protein